jgi:hypothetical protein
MREIEVPRTAMPTWVNGKIVALLAALAGLAAVLLTLSLGLVGRDGEDGRVEDAVREYTTGLASFNGGRACSVLTPAARRELVEELREHFLATGARSCPEAVRRSSLPLVTDTEALERPRIEDVRVSGRRARVEVNGDSLELVRMGGRWLLDGPLFLDPDVAQPA